MIKHTITGQRHRVQFRVIDLTGEDVSANVRQARPTFCVYVLDTKYHKATSFSVAGQRVYYGDDPDAACDVAQKYATISQLPRNFLDYLTKWAKQSA